MALTKVSPGLLNAEAQAQGFRNRIINGDMRIDQRNAGASVDASNTSSNVYLLDRWSYRVTAASKFTVQQNAGSVTPPTGFTNYMGITSSSAYSVLTTDLLAISNKIEGLDIADLDWGTASAKTVTLSFWVRSSLTGTFGGALRNSAGNMGYPFTYTISSANTWEQKTVTISGPTSGTWLTTNGIGIDLRFGIGVGSTYTQAADVWYSGSPAPVSATGVTDVVATNGATWYITGVQLEVGSVATEFERRPYGTELALCQRYTYAKRGSEGTGGASMLGAMGNARSTTAAFVQLTFPTTMRTLPTLTVTNPASFLLYQTSVIQATAVSLDVADPTAASIQVTVASGLTSPTFYSFGCNNGNALLVFSSEL